MPDPAPSTGEPPGDRAPLAVRLLGRPSLPGALVVALVAAFYVVALPALADSVTAPAPPRVIELASGATVTTSDDWTESAAPDGATTVTQGGATLVFSDPRPSESHVAVTLDQFTSAWLASAPDGSVATAPRSFETAAGDRAATVVLQEPLQTMQAWVVSNGDVEVVVVLTAPAAAWDKTSASAQELVRTLVIPPIVGAPQAPAGSRVLTGPGGGP